MEKNDNLVTPNLPSQIQNWKTWQSRFIFSALKTPTYSHNYTHVDRLQNQLWLAFVELMISTASTVSIILFVLLFLPTLLTRLFFKELTE